jgi:hypothetical protein
MKNGRLMTRKSIVIDITDPRILIEKPTLEHQLFMGKSLWRYQTAII